MGCDKSDLMIDGKTFLEMQIEKGEKLGISDIILSGYHGEKKYKYPVVTDRIPGKGTTWRSGSMLAQGREPTLSGAWC